MTDTKTELARADLSKIAGGDCTPQEWITLTTELTAAYESLIDFTSYVFTRVTGGQQ